MKEILRLESGFEIDGDRIDDRYVERQLNDWDEYALEEAIQIREAFDEDVEVAAVTVGPFYAVDTVNRALAHGADRAIRVWDDALTEGDPRDPLPIARVLSKVVEREQPDLVLAGAQSGDVSYGATGVLVAEQTGYNWSAVVDDIRFENGAVVVEREIEGGFNETTKVQLPAVITVQSGINDPRYISLRSIRRQSSEDRITTLDFGDLELDPSVADSDVRVHKLETPDQVETTYLNGDAAEEAAELIKVLESEGVLG